MNINNQLLFAIVLSVYSFLSIRNTLWAIKELYLSKNEQKRRKKGQTVKEWFFYLRYREEIPEMMLWLYYIILILHPLLIVCVGFACLYPSFREITSVMTIAVIAFDSLWSILTIIFSWKPGSRDLHYEQWIKKIPRKK